MLNDSRLDVGAGGVRRVGYVSLDNSPSTRPDVLHDIEYKWPFDDNQFEEVRAHHVLEHVHTEKKTFVMYEAWRVLKPGGVMDVEVPAFPFVQAVMDPGHISFWCRESWLYYEHGSRFRDAYAARAGQPVPSFKVLESKQDGWKLALRLEAVKS
ncbi:MAG: methyltransferase domain-containing protein [Sphaerochaeta sp.]|nr:methyltransferase domain-containing protein [Sphaerochaeta sp.]